MNRLTIDFETRSACDLKKAGAYKYSLDSSTMPTCMAFKTRSNPNTALLKFHMVNLPFEKTPIEFQKNWARFINEGYLFVAHNAFFEQCIYNNIMVRRYGWPKIPPRLWRCTAAKAAACALPRSLEGAGAAMELTTQKDKRGFVAMMLTCKPTRAWNAWNKEHEKLKHQDDPVLLLNSIKNEPPKFLEPGANPQVWETLYTYCKIDVKTEELLDMALPDLIPDEQEIWFLNQRLNWRGLRIDIPTVKKIVGIMEVEGKKKLKELDHLTNGMITKPGAIASILEFIREEKGGAMPNLRAKTVDDKLKEDGISPRVRRLLELRQMLSKTSTKKYQTFLNRAMPDWRCRDILLYHGASTGRDTGVGLQPHNFPRGMMKVDKNDPYADVENVAQWDYETLKMIYGDALPIVFSSILRNMIIPSDGCELYVADFSKIEVAVLWWLAGNEEGLKILHSGRDPYIYQAAKNIGKTYEEIERAVNRGEKWAEDARQLGKAQVLGCGFGMGWEKFMGTAFDQYRLTLTESQSRDAVYNYRNANEAVPTLWVLYEQAANKAIEEGKTVRVGKCKFFCKNKFLWVELPSGRRLAYRKPTVYFKQKLWGEYKQIEFLGLAPNKKELRPELTWGGKLTENIVQAVARDLIMPAMLRLEKNGYIPLLMVHDEGICEMKKDKGDVKRFVKLLCQRPAWVDESLPLDAKGWVGSRYRK